MAFPDGDWFDSDDQRLIRISMYKDTAIGPIQHFRTQLARRFAGHRNCAYREHWDLG